MNRVACEMSVGSCGTAFPATGRIRGVYCDAVLSSIVHWNFRRLGLVIDGGSGVATFDSGVLEGLLVAFRLIFFLSSESPFSLTRCPIWLVAIGVVESAALLDPRMTEHRISLSRVAVSVAVSWSNLEYCFWRTSVRKSHFLGRSSLSHVEESETLPERKYRI